MSKQKFKVGDRVAVAWTKGQFTVTGVHRTWLELGEFAVAIEDAYRVSRPTHAPRKPTRLVRLGWMVADPGCIYPTPARAASIAMGGRIVAVYAKVSDVKGSK